MAINPKDGKPFKVDPPAKFDGRANELTKASEEKIEDLTHLHEEVNESLSLTVSAHLIAQKGDFPPTSDGDDDDDGGDGGDA